MSASFETVTAPAAPWDARQRMPPIARARDVRWERWDKDHWRDVEFAIERVLDFLYSLEFSNHVVRVDVERLRQELHAWLYRTS